MGILMADDPISLAAERAYRQGNASLWTPRDVLADTLRRLDAGEIAPDVLLITWREKTSPAHTKTNFAQCGPDVHTALGLLSATAMIIFEGSGK
jgi:hypothetical protein